MRNEKGFSLIELMIVVAIIGILAAIAVPNFQKYQAKSRQGEAKAILSGIYTAQKAFFAEWNMYTGDFGHIGFSPEGDLRYNTGFTALGTDPTTLANYTGPSASGNLDTASHCAALGSCTDNSGAPAIVSSVTPALAPPVFTAGAIATGVGDIDGDATTDNWTIDQTKAIRVVTNDLDD